MATPIQTTSLRCLRTISNPNKINIVRRYVSTQSKAPFVLEKPDKFRPPSHPSRIVKRQIPRNYAGPPLSAEELEAQKTKQYPNMFPPEGTKMHWFLTNKRLHLVIAMSTLCGMAGYIFIADFHKHNKYPDLLPPGRLFWTGHPFQYIGQYASVYKMHVEARSAEVGEKRRKNIEDAQKRKQFLKEHGLWKDRWWLGEEPTPEEKAETDRKERVRIQAEDAAQSPIAMPATSAATSTTGYRDFDGNTATPKKRLGIW